METVERTTPIVSLTETAAAKIRELQAEEPDGDATVLRLAVQGGDAEAGIVGQDQSA